MTRGPAPKQGAVRRNTHQFAQRLAADVSHAGRELPKSLGVTTTGARRFWRTWACSPQSAAWAETDWAELEITVKLVDAFYQGETRHAGEIRQRVSRWGATVEDRARLRMSIEDQPPAEAGTPAEDEMTPTDMDEELYRLLNGE